LPAEKVFFSIMFATCGYVKCSNLFAQRNANHRFCSPLCWHKQQRLNSQGSDYKRWKLAVLNRDNHACQMCGTRDGKIIAHHLLTISESPETRLEVSNGLSLCTDCHEVIHDNVGKSNPALIYRDERKRQGYD